MRLADRIRRYRNEEAGTVALLWALSLVVFIGFIALGLDIGRLGATQSEFQSYADHVALVAAGELDGKSDSITRAQAAAANLISDTQTFADGGATLSGTSSYTLTFHTELPSSDLAALGANQTTNPRLAKFAHVVITPRNLSMGLAGAVDSLTGGNGSIANVNVSATAVAGFTQQACDISPLMFCLPPSWETTINPGDMILLRSGGNGSAWGPGNFGFIDLDIFGDVSGTCASKNGNELACMIGAQEGISSCVRTDGTIDTEPGQKVGITNAAFNVRFDIFRATLNKFKNDADFPPAPNVIKGIRPNGGGSCIGGNEQPTGDTMGLPRDTCMPTCGRFGDGVWNRDLYLLTNHDDDGDLSNGTPFTNATSSPYPTTHPLYQSRYAMYLREIAFSQSAANPYKPNGNPSPPFPILNRSETGLQQCSNQTTGIPERRVIIAAGVDCDPVTGTAISGATTGVPVERYFAMFLTEPVGDDGGSPPSFDIHAEFLGYADVPGGGSNGFGGIFRDVVQLYR